MAFRSIAPSKTVDTSSLAGLGKSVLDLAQWAYLEFNGIQAALVSTEPDKIWTSVPPKPRRGTIAYADGTNWNPGAGEGPYYYDGSAWHSMKAPTIPTITPPALVLLETVSLAGLTSYASVASWSGYTGIRLVVSDLTTSAAGVNTPYIEYHSAGAYQNTNYLSAGNIIFVNTSGASITGGALITTGALLFGYGNLDASTTAEGASFEAVLHNITDTTTHKHVVSYGGLRTSTVNNYVSLADGVWIGGTTAIDGCRLKLTGAANMSGGTMRIYGMT